MGMVGALIFGSIVAFGATKPQWIESESALNAEGDVIRFEVIDWDHDGDLDIVIVVRSGVGYWQNRGDGMFERVGGFLTPDSSFAIEMGDWDRDGDLDLLSVRTSERTELNQVVSRAPTPVTIWLNNGNYGFVEQSKFFFLESEFGYDEVAIVVGDVDMDGDLDLVTSVVAVVEQFADPARPFAEEVFETAVFLNDGNGNFLKNAILPANASLYSSLVLGDLDGDSDLDLVRRYGFSSLFSIWANDGSGGFVLLEDSIPWPNSDLLFFASGRTFCLRDVDGDGDLDLPIPVRSGPNFVLLNEGGGILKGEVPAGYGSGAGLIEVADLDRDGLPDLVSNGLPSVTGASSGDASRGSMVVRIAGAMGAYSDVQTLKGGDPQDVKIADFNADGLPDIAVAYRSRVAIWMQREPVALSIAEITLAVIEDPVARAVISETLGKLADQVTVFDLGTINELDFSRRGLRELSLPDGLKGLRALVLDNNALSVFRLPMDAVNVDAISLHGNQSPIVTLSGAFRNLRSLIFTGAGLRELIVEEEFPSLEILGLWGTGVRDFSFLSQIPNLSDLNLGDMGLRAVTVPLGLRRLENLWLSMNPVREVQVPVGMTIENVFGFAKQRITFYDPIPEIGSWSLIDSKEFAFEVTAGDGTVVVERSRDLRSWIKIGSLPVKDWKTRFSSMIEEGEGAFFFRATASVGEESTEP